MKFEHTDFCNDCSSFANVGMAKTRSMTRNRNHDDVPSKKMFKTFDKGGVAPWSDLNHDALFLVMMQLGIIDFVAFSGVCKAWRSFALSNKKVFTASRPPLLLWITDCPYTKECYLEDSEKRKYKTLLPHSAGRKCVGITSGYLVLMGRRTKDFWLVNPITRHELHFPAYPSSFTISLRPLFFLLAISTGWVFVALDRCTHTIWFSEAGKGSWNLVSDAFDIYDLLVFKGKIYALTFYLCVHELRLYPEPKLMILKTQNSVESTFIHREFVSSGENLLVALRYDILYELDLVEMKWVCHDKDREDYLFFRSKGMQTVAVKSDLCPHWPQFHEFASKEKDDVDCIWYYFLDECFSVKFMDDC